MIYAGAGNRTRTGDIDLGKVALYQLSYARVVRRRRVSEPLARSQGRLTGRGRDVFRRADARAQRLGVRQHQLPLWYNAGYESGGLRRRTPKRLAARRYLIPYAWSLR